MTKFLLIITMLAPLTCFSQISINGSVLNRSNNRPVEYANVFLNNSSIGTTTDKNGRFTLQNVKPGIYDLIISFIGYQTYHQKVTISNTPINLSNVFIDSKTTNLKEVTIKPKSEEDRYNYLAWFTEEFIGKSQFSFDCKILNPDVLDFDYDKTTHTLTASASGFLKIQNSALGYNIKFLLNEFELSNKGELVEKVHYDGWTLFEKMKGSASEERRWQKLRQQDYEGSPKQFLSSLTVPQWTNEFSQSFQDGFWTMRLVTYPNPKRPSDSLIQAKINYFKKSEIIGKKDSLTKWRKIDDLPKSLRRLYNDNLSTGEFVRKTNQKGIYALGLSRSSYSLFINYQKDRLKKAKNGRITLSVQPIDNLSSARNTENTLISFNKPFAFFDRNGEVLNVNSLTFSGVWAKRRMADLLPTDFVPTRADNKVEDNLIFKVNKFTNDHIPEKTYLQFDKSGYYPGDTIYFKAYILKGDEHVVSDLSNVLHVDLMGPDNKTVQSIKLPIDSGTAWGDFTIPVTHLHGNYRVRAYTRLMKNEAQSNYFDQTISWAAKNSQITEPNNSSTQNNEIEPAIQFFPEGGHLTAGLKSKIAFIVIDDNGSGVNIKGILVDNDNKQLSSFASSYMGLGYFYLNPEIGKAYKAIISYADGRKKTFNLPEPNNNGIILSVKNDSVSKASVSIQTNNAYYLKNKGAFFTLLISSGDVNTKIPFALDSTMFHIDLLKDRMPTGVARIALFSPTGLFLADRMLFIQNDDQLKLHLSTDSSEYSRNQAVHIRLKAVNEFGEPAKGSFSVSVVKENIPANDMDENTIMNTVLLQSSLKENVRRPDYYFTDTSATKRNRIDLLMLTDTYRYFGWEKLLNDKEQPLTFSAEKGLKICGLVKNTDGKLLSDIPVSLKSLSDGALLHQITGKNGRFCYDSLAFTGTAHFIISATNPKRENTPVTITYDDRNNEPDEVSSPNIANTDKNSQSPRNITAASKGNFVSASLPIAVAGYYQPHEFKLPGDHSANLTAEERHSTIYWKPNIITDKNGFASFDFASGNSSGIYRIIIEGIDENGNLGRVVFQYRVVD